MTDTVANYLPPFFPRPSHGVIARADGVTYAEWESGPGWDRWGSSLEWGSKRTISGVDYAYVDGYSIDGKPEYWPVQSVRDLVTMPDGMVIDLAASGVMGSSYMPWNLPDVGVITIEQWFWIYASINRDGRRPGYWKSEFTFGAVMDNPGWLGSGPRTRRVVRQREVWWDSVGGWARGHPTAIGAVPWIGETPQDVAVDFDQVNYIGKDAGPLWRGTNAGVELHLQNVEFFGGTKVGKTITVSDATYAELAGIFGGTASAQTGVTGLTVTNSKGVWTLGPANAALLNGNHFAGGFGTVYKRDGDTVWIKGNDDPPNWYLQDVDTWRNVGPNEPSAPIRTAPTPPLPPPGPTGATVPPPPPVPTGATLSPALEPFANLSPLTGENLVRIAVQKRSGHFDDVLKANLGASWAIYINAYADEATFGMDKEKIKGAELVAAWQTLTNGDANPIAKANVDAVRTFLVAGVFRKGGSVSGFVGT